MLSRAVKEHQAKQTQTKEKQELRRKEAVAAAGIFSQVLVDSLNSNVEKAYGNQRLLEAEAKQLQGHISRFNRQSQQWVTMIESFNQALKELGDVENWARAIETDMTTVASALECAYKGSAPR